VIINRIIKFRAWDESQNYMAYQGTPDLETIQSFIYHFGDKTLMQYTGVSDVNGKEIYEGDIVVPTKFKDVPNVVQYVQNGFYRVKKHGEKTYVNPLGNCQIKVIGNIFESTKLSKKD
jgi:uncharacterized phage protein (TIGR01671 family)